MKRRKGGAVLILAGFLLILTALGIILYNLWDGERAARASREILEVLDAQERGKTPVAPRAQDQEVDARVDAEDPNWFERMEMPVTAIDGYDYIGTLEIPDLSLRLPVMAAWDYDRLKVSPCRYSGSYFTNDLVICAHNYQKHFSPIKWIDIGADVYFVTVDKVVYHYTVSNRETVQPTAIEQMVENDYRNTGAAGNWDLTLFTCNTGGQTRCAVRCVRVD